MTALQQVRTLPGLRMLAGLMLFLGAHNAALYPYQSLVALGHFGLPEAMFAAMLVIASAASVTASVLFGLLGDQSGARRRIAIATALCSTLGLALMLALPGPWTFLLFHGLLLPISWSLYGQAFSMARVLAKGDSNARAGVLATLRAGLSASYLAMLLVWTGAFALGFDVMAVYGAAAVMSLGLLVLVLFRWPADDGHAGAIAPTGQKLWQSFRDLADPAVALRLGCLGAITSAGGLYMVLIPLIFAASPLRGNAEVALYVGMVAGWEVPFMLLLPRIAGRIGRTALIGIGAAIYTCHLALLPVLTDSAALWLLPLFAGLGGAAILTLPIGYYQDLMVDRPGAASSLIAMQKLVSDVLAAGAFMAGLALGGYEGAAILGTLLALGGGLGLMLADRGGLPQPRFITRRAVPAEQG